MYTNVFVYGSLLSGMGNHPVLGDSAKVGDFEIRGFDMYSLGAFPGIVPVRDNKPKGTGQITGEVYRCDETTMRRLDRLEGAPDFYHRREVEARDNATGAIYKAIVYVLTRWSEVNGAKLVHNGDWRAFCRKNDSRMEF